MGRGSLFTAVVAAALGCSQALGAGAVVEVVVTLPYQVAPAAIAFIAAKGVPDREALTVGQDLYSPILKRCGVIDPVYLRALLAANAKYFSDKKSFDELAGLSAPVEIAFPACAMSPQPKSVAIGVGDSLGTIADRNRVPLDSKDLDVRPREDGSSGYTMDTIAALRQATMDLDHLPALGVVRNYYAVLNAQTLKAAGVLPRRLTPGGMVVFPGLAPEASRVRFLVADSADGVRSDLAKALALDGSDVSADIAVVGQCGGADVANDRWPYNLERLLQVLGLERQAQAKRGIRDFKLTTIMVVDSGFDPNLIERSPAFLRSSFETVAALGGSTQMEPGTQVSGLNLANSLDQRGEPNNSTPDRRYAAWRHGVEVAGVALGGRQLQWVRSLGPLVKILPVSMVNTVDGTERLEALRKAIEVADDNDIRVITASIVSTQEINDFNNIAREHGGKIVFVTAAGNSTELTGEASRPLTPLSAGDAVYPAMYGGDPAHAMFSGMAVITVGASDAGLNPAPFSRPGKDYVDVLAPGCSIPTYVPTAGDGPGALMDGLPTREETVTGTSFAAPQVAFIAALLTSEGLSPIEVKRRIMASADYSKALADQVWSGGRLNPYAALAVSYDTLAVSRLNDTDAPAVLVGTVRERQSIKLCNGAYTSQQVNRFWLRHEANGWGSGVWAKDKWAGAACSEATDLEQKLNFLDASTGEIKAIPLNSVREWVPPYYR